MGMKVQASTLVPNGTAYSIDARVAAVTFVCRDVMVEVWSDLWAGEFSVEASNMVWS